MFAPLYEKFGFFDTDFEAVYTTLNPPTTLKEQCKIAIYEVLSGKDDVDFSFSTTSREDQKLQNCSEAVKRKFNDFVQVLIGMDLTEAVASKSSVTESN